MLEKIISELSFGKELSSNDVEYLKHQFKGKAIRAIEAVQNNSVYLFTFLPSGREFWCVSGREEDHLVFRQTYCDCLDFYMNIVIKGKEECCYHLLAVEIAKKMEKIHHITMNDEEYKKVRNKFK